MARSIVGIVVAAALLIVTGHQLAARSMAEPAGAETVCLLAPDAGGGMSGHKDCGLAGAGHAGCLSHSGCAAFTLPSAQFLNPSPGSPRWLSPKVRGLLGRIIPLETPPPIVEA